MIIKSLFALFFCVYIIKVVAITSFSTLTDRPKLFELTDNEVATFRITIPEDELKVLYENSKVIGLSKPKGTVQYYFDKFVKELPGLLTEYFFKNFTKIFPEVDCRKEFPDLNILRDGYPDIDYEKVLSGIDLDPHNYVNFDFINRDLATHLLETCTTFDYTGIVEKIYRYNEIYHKNFFYERTSHLPVLENTNDKVETKYNSTYLKTQEFINEYRNPKDFETKNATLKVELAGTIKSFDKVTFSFSGQYARYLEKPSYNIKIRGGENLYGRSRLKLRSDYGEPTFLRTKLTADIHSKLGLRSILANFAVLYLNDEYMGLFILTDAYKRSWVELVYGEKDTKNLYKCNPGSFINNSSLRSCTNEIDQFFDARDMMEFMDFLEIASHSKRKEEIEKVFDVESFLYEMAIEYLIGSWDNLQYGHNYYLYKQPNGKWIYLSYDFDQTFGNNLDRVYVELLYEDIPERMQLINRDYPNYSFEMWIHQIPLIQVLV